MKNIRFLFLLLFAAGPCFPAPAFAQTPVEGYVFESDNRGFLQQAKVTIYELPGNIVRAEVATDTFGRFAVPLMPGRYRVFCQKDVFHDRQDTIAVGAEKLYLKLEMRRRPGYLFDATLAELREKPGQPADGISGAWIEVYNRTAKRTELNLENHPGAFFQFTFEQGNHYTIMIRKPGYLTKRIEAYVDVEGCIICIDGVRTLTPGVTENLTADNKMGTLLANIELERAKIDQRIEIKNIYYDYDKWDIRPEAAVELDKVVTLLKDNPGMSVELGSHTDARGRDAYNDTLSQKRAEAAVRYIVGEGIAQERITAKGYGETQLVNGCANDVECSEAEHQLNRRTELRITGLSQTTEDLQPLEKIIREEALKKAKKRDSGGKG